MKKRTDFWAWLLILVLLLVGAVLLLPVTLLPFRTLKSLGDSLAADGNLERLTPQWYSSMHLPMLLFGILLLAGAVAWTIWRRQAQRLLVWGAFFARQLGRELRAGLHELTADIRAGLPPRRELLVLCAILTFAIFMRLVLIQKPMAYDESYTFTEFARHPFKEIVSDYHVRNNHVFHTLLVRVAYLLFGNAPWVVRLPALIAGLLLIPAVYALGRRLYNGSTGLLAAGGVAVYPILAEYAVNARGYTILCLFMALLILLADYAREKRNLAAWALMALVTALGMYTIPIMLYPFGIAVAWLFLSGIFGKIHPGYCGKLRWMISLVVFCAVSGLLTLLLYAPILHRYGLMAVLNDNPAFETQSLSTFLFELPYQFQFGKGELLDGGLNDAVLWLLAFGSLLSLALHRWISRRGLPLQLAAVLFLVPMLLVQRPVFLARVWLYFLVLTILWTAAGLIGLARLLRLSEVRYQQVRGWTASLLLLALLAGGVRFLAPSLANPDLVRYPPLSDAERVTLYLKDRLRNGDIVILTNEEDAPYWYYFTYYKIPDARIRAVKSHPFRHAYVITHPVSNWTERGIIKKFGPDLWFFRMETLRLETQIDDTLIYSVEPNQAAIDQEFGPQSWQ